MLAIAVAVGAALMRLAGSEWKPAVPANAAVTVLGGLAALLILIRIVFPPGFGTIGGISINATLKVGVFLALAAAIGIAYGGYRAMREAGDSFQGIAQRLESDRPKPKPRRKPKREKDAAAGSSDAAAAKPKPPGPAAKQPSKRRSRSSSD
jgi:hypothetical protein